MEATIEFKKKVNEATIQINGQEQYVTVDKKGFFVQKIALHRCQDNKHILDGYCRMLPPKFAVIMADGAEYRLRMDGVQALRYFCEKGGNNYEIYQHKDRKYSIYKNGNQTAYWDKAEVAVFGADKYSLIADSHSDIELFLGMLLTFHIVDGSSKQSVYSKDRGNIWEKRAFDTNWKPK
jgi:hypothetical protein